MREMTTLPPKQPPHQRKSTETDQRHLLADSVAPSESASIITAHGEEGDITPRARSPIRAASRASLRSHTTATSISYKGFPSEAEYLAALQEWADNKKYLDSGTRLVGFYGPKTTEDYANQPGVEIGLRRKWRARKERKAVKAGERRNTVA